MRPTDKRPAAIFDLDLTLTRKDSFRAFIIWFYLYDIRRWSFLPYLVLKALMRKMGLISRTAFMEAMLKGLASMTISEIKAVGRAFFNARLSPDIKGGGLLRQQGVDRLAFHRARGDRIFIVTGSPDIYVGFLSRCLGCDAYACTRLKIQNSRFTGRLLGSPCLAREKTVRLTALVQQFNLDLPKSVAYSDHESDLPVFAFAGRQVAVSPSPALSRIARLRGWPVVFW